MEYKNFLNFPILFYLILVLFIILPFILNHPKFIAGGDLDFTDYGIKVQIEREFYLWRDIDGYGGLSVGKYPLIFISIFIYLVNSLIPGVLLQPFLFILFYTSGYWGLFFLLKEYSVKINALKNDLALSALSLFYFTNLFAFNLLKLPTFLFLSFISFTPLIIFLFIYNMKRKSRFGFLLFVLVTLFNTYTFVNITNAIVQSMTIVFLTIPFIDKKNYKKLLTLFLIYFLINIPSIFEYLVFYFSGKEYILNSQSQRLIVESSKSVQLQLFNLKNIISLFSGDLFGKWWNSKGLVDNFIYKSIYISYPYQIILLIPIFLFIISLFFKEKLKILLYINVVVLGSIILIAAMGFAPLTHLWERLYEYSLFEIFRNSTKFWPLLIISLCISIIPILNKKKFLYLFLIYLLFLNFYSISGNIFNKDNFINIPENYQINNLNKNLNLLDNNSIGIIYPAKNFFLYGFKWGYMGWSPFLSLQNKLPLLHRQGDFLSQANKNIYDQLIDENISYNLEKNIFRKYRVKYIILHKDIKYNVFNYNNNYEFLKISLDKKFKKVLSTENYDIYETYPEKVSILESNNSFFQKSNPAKYHIYIKGLNKSKVLSFSESYNSNWKLYLVKNPNRSWCQPLEYYNISQTTECKVIPSFFQGEELSYLWKNPLFVNSHNQTSDYTNNWVINRNYIKSNYSKEYFKENPDGSIDIELVLYFKPQSYFYLGLIISSTTLICCLAYLIYDWRSEKARFKYDKLPRTYLMGERVLVKID